MKVVYLSSLTNAYALLKVLNLYKVDYKILQDSSEYDYFGHENHNYYQIIHEKPSIMLPHVNYFFIHKKKVSSFSSIDEKLPDILINSLTINQLIEKKLGLLPISGNSNYYYDRFNYPLEKYKNKHNQYLLYSTFFLDKYFIRTSSHITNFIFRLIKILLKKNRSVKKYRDSWELFDNVLLSIKKAI